MNLIERAGMHLESKSPKSLVEQAADRLAEADERAKPHRDATAALSAVQRTDVPVAELGTQRPGREVTIDLDRLRAMGVVLPGAQSYLAEEIRLIKQPLLSTALFQAGSSLENRNVLMVTSAGASEGKTFVATNLALSMASEHGVHVLLIDADVVKPAIPALLGFKADVGVIDVVADPTIDFANVVLRTNIENLTILPSGHPRPGMAELLASKRMADFVSEVSRRYPDRVIIFDSPPVLARSEPIVLARHVGQVVFVVEAERTSRTAMDEAIGLIGRDKIAGVVLNKAPYVIGQEGFGRGYGYYNYQVDKVVE
jgi:protein-tyrosine kinase